MLIVYKSSGGEMRNTNRVRQKHGEQAKQLQGKWSASGNDFREGGEEWSNQRMRRSKAGPSCLAPTGCL